MATRPDGGKDVINDVLRLLTNPRRRMVLYYLQEHEVANVDELAEHIAAQSGKALNQEAKDRQVEQITLELVHTSLPNLADSQFIEYDARSRTVRYSEPPEPLETILWILSRFE